MSCLALPCLSHMYRIYDRPEVRALFKQKPRKIHVIRKIKKHHVSKRQESLDIEDHSHVKVNAHNYQENHQRNLKQDEKDKQLGKKDMFALN
jgi:hypothetical protein